MKQKLQTIDLILSSFNIKESMKEDLLLDIRNNFTNYIKWSKRILGFRNNMKYDQSIDVLREEKPEFIFKLLLASLLDLKEYYEKRNIKEEVFYDTISDIFLRFKIYEKQNLSIGLTQEDVEWLLRIFDLSIFKLGSLQFEMTKFYFNNYKVKWSSNSKKIIKNGENVLSIHIMEGEDLSPGEIEKSLKYGKSFFKENFTDFEYRYFYCWSWLLYRGNQELLGKDSNIIKFTNFFDIIGESDNPDMGIERIFGCPKEEIELNERSTSLQKSAAQNINNLGISAGIIKKVKFEKMIIKSPKSRHGFRGFYYHFTDPEVRPVIKNFLNIIAIIAGGIIEKIPDTAIRP